MFKQKLLDFIYSFRVKNTKLCIFLVLILMNFLHLFIFTSWFVYPFWYYLLTTCRTCLQVGKEFCIYLDLLSDLENRMCCINLNIAHTIIHLIFCYSSLCWRSIDRSLLISPFSYRTNIICKLVLIIVNLEAIF